MGFIPASERRSATSVCRCCHPGGNPGPNRKSNSHRCHPILVVFPWELTKETIDLPMGCLQVGHVRLKDGACLAALERDSYNSKGSKDACLKPRPDFGLVLSKC